MNIFLLDTDPVACARMHCDAHVVKMILETAQLISVAVKTADWAERLVLPHYLYKVTHKNHPCAIWAREDKANFKWLVRLGMALLDEYHYRYSKTHKSAQVIEWADTMVNYSGSLFFDIFEPTEFALAMPDEFRPFNGCLRAFPPVAVDSYRKYYLRHKSHMFHYKRRTAPRWILEGEPA